MSIEHSHKSSEKTEQQLSAKGKTRVKFWLGLALGISLLAFALYRIGYDKLVDSLGALEYRWLGLALVVKLLAIAVKGVRWGEIIANTTGQKSKAHLRATFLGYFGNAILVLKLGELLRLNIAQKHNECSYLSLLGTMIFERAMDALLLLILLALCVVYLPVPPWAEQALLPASAITALLVLSLLFLALRQIQLPDFLFPTSLGRWLKPRIQTILDKIGQGLRSARSAKVWTLVFSMTFLAWALEILGTHFAVSALGTQLPWQAAIVVTVLVALGLAFPAAPAGLGPHQWLYVLLLAPYGVPEEKAVALSLATVASMILSLGVVAIFMAAIEKRATPP